MRNSNECNSGAKEFFSVRVILKKQNCTNKFVRILKNLTKSS